MCLVWRGGLSSWNIWTRSVPRSSLLRSSHLDMGSSSWCRHPLRDAARSHQAGQAGQASLTWLGRLTWLDRRSPLRGSGAASGAQALHQQGQRSALARCRTTQFFLHSLFFYISFYASPLVNAQFWACNQCRKESSPKSLGSLPCTLSFS